jgi:hypothetical protein
MVERLQSDDFPRGVQIDRDAIPIIAAHHCNGRYAGLKCWLDRGDTIEVNGLRYFVAIPACRSELLWGPVTSLVQLLNERLGPSLIEYKEFQSVLSRYYIKPSKSRNYGKWVRAYDNGRSRVWYDLPKTLAAIGKPDSCRMCGRTGIGWHQGAIPGVTRTRNFRLLPVCRECGSEAQSKYDESRKITCGVCGARALPFCTFGNTPSLHPCCSYECFKEDRRRRIVGRCVDRNRADAEMELQRVLLLESKC